MAQQPMQSIDSFPLYLRELNKQKRPQNLLDTIEKYVTTHTNISSSAQQSIYWYTAIANNALGLYIKEEQSYLDILQMEISDSLKADVQFNLSLCYYNQGKFDEAIRYANLSKDLSKARYGEENKVYIRCLNSLGQFVKEQSKLKEAEQYFLEAKKLNYRITKGRDLQYARILNNLGDVYTTWQRFEKAEELYKTSLLIKSQLGLGGNAEYGKSLYNLSKFYYTIGKYELALYNIEAAIKSNNLTVTSSTLKMQDLLASIHFKLGNILESEKIFRQLITYREEHSMTSLTEYALNLMNLSTIFLQQRKVDSCIRYAKNAIQTFKKNNSTDHIHLASMITTLGDAETISESFPDALSHYEQAAAMIVRQLGKEHVNYFVNQFHYARLLRKMGMIQKAKIVFKEVDAIPKKYLKRVSKFLSEFEIEQFTETIREYHEEIYSFNKQMPFDADLCMLSYDNALFYKGFIQHNLIRLRESLSRTKEISELKETWLTQQEQLDRMIKFDSLAVEELSSLKNSIDQTEYSIQVKLQKLGLEERLINWKDVQVVLDEKEVAIEFVEFEENGQNEYAAVVLKPNSKAPVFIPLVKEIQLQLLIQPQVIPWPMYIASIYNYQKRALVQIDKKKMSIYDILWRPLTAEINRGSIVYFSAAGWMHRISHDAIPVSFSENLSDLYNLRQLGSTRSLAELEESLHLEEPDEVLLVGGLRYTLEDTLDNGDHLSWSYLPWTRSEVQGIDSICRHQHIPSQVMLDHQATEQNLNERISTSQRGFRFIHLSTHAYFKQQRDSILLASRGSSGDQKSSETGIVLSNANLMVEQSQAESDGIWSSTEISRLDLHNTNLVVLSACETGLGSIQTQEGVYGLQRAFRIAGAKALMMSLWQIPDQETHDFMLKFYKHYLVEKHDIRDSFQLTQREMRARFINPEQWAGFVLVE